ncbi:MAG: hypothetical protein L0027_13510, partial [Candidatus Rokubacteria bacterium]|nr:hypothetical protein [Candidatus Rokubacteria bacterium]
MSELTDETVRSVDSAMRGEWLDIGNPGSGGLVNEARDYSEDEVWSVGPCLWGNHRNDHRLCVGWLDNLRHYPNDDQRGGLGE